MSKEKIQLPPEMAIAQSKKKMLSYMGFAAKARKIGHRPSPLGPPLGRVLLPGLGCVTGLNIFFQQADRGALAAGRRQSFRSFFLLHRYLLVCFCRS